MKTRRIFRNTGNSQSTSSGKRQQLDQTLAKTEAALIALINNNAPQYDNFTKLAQDVASTVGVDPSLYRKRNTPQKKLFDAYAIKLCKKVPRSTAEALIPKETLQAKLSEAQRRIATLERVLSDLQLSLKPNLTNRNMARVETDNFLHAFELTCQLVETILKEDQFLYFEKGILMTRATMTAIPAALSESKICKPFLEWRHAKDINFGSISTADLEKSLRSSAETRDRDID